MITKRFPRLGTLFLTGLVAVLTLAVGVHAAQTITTPNAAVVKYSLAAGDNSAAVTPAESTPVLVMGVQNSLGYRGVGQVALLHVPSSFLEWTGIESPAAPPSPPALAAPRARTFSTWIIPTWYRSKLPARTLS